MLFSIIYIHMHAASHLGPRYDDRVSDVVPTTKPVYAKPVYGIYRVISSTGHAMHVRPFELLLFITRGEQSMAHSIILLPNKVLTRRRSFTSSFAFPKQASETDREQGLLFQCYSFLPNKTQVWIR
jgi:hypothetical protein